jgi:hypothetical protein
MMTRLLLLIGICWLLTSGRPPAPPSTGDLTVSYTISIRSKRTNKGIAETYNGGIQTLFARTGEARLRLVSLMRIQSTFIFLDKEQVKEVVLVKESGASKHKTVLSPAQWKTYNDKYTGLTCKLSADTVLILKHLCSKAILTLKDGRQIIAWYTPVIQKPICSLIEPAFSAIPGLVLRYEYTYRKKTISYTATSIKSDPIGTAVFNASR